jgi:hypothetical protein
MNPNPQNIPCYSRALDDRARPVGLGWVHVIGRLKLPGLPDRTKFRVKTLGMTNFSPGLTPMRPVILDSSAYTLLLHQ